MQRNIIIFDFEVFKYNTLFGAKVLQNDDIKTYQTWNLSEMQHFYYDNKESIWIGHNNSTYDNLILQEVVKGKNEIEIKQTSDSLMNTTKKPYLNIPLYWYDLIALHFVGLKVVECAVGKNISTSEVDFNLDRPLTEEEKSKTESYNRDDLEQTLDDFYSILPEFTLRLDMIKEFNLSLDALHLTGTQIAELVLHAKKIDGIEDYYIPPTIPPQLNIKNKDVLNFYLNEDFRKGKKLSIDILGTPHTLGVGGIHGDIKKYHNDCVYYFDVSGYYNLLMINYDLLPRSIPEKYKQVYVNMYYDQLKLKKTNPRKRKVYKEILLSVFGATMNEYCKFYDPNKGTLITILGQMFLIDLLEKFENKAKIIQSNTDGVIIEPFDGVTENDICEIIDEWQNRTGFVLKFDKIYNIHQRDVNNYIYCEADGSVVTKGEVFKHYDCWENVFQKDSFRAKEPIIIEHAVVDYFIHNKLPEETIDFYKNNLRMFQFICKKNTYDYLDIEKTDLLSNSTEIEHLGAICRAFAYNNNNVKQTIYKHKPNGKVPKSVLQNLPNNVFVYNNEILSNDAVNEIIPNINYDYYVNRAYERIAEFYNIIKVKKIL